MTTLKLTITCLIVALFWNIAATQQLSIYTSNATAENEPRPRDIILACGMTGHWATIARFNKSDKNAKGFDPSYTVIFAKYKPIIRKVGESWQITFTSEIAENLP